MQLDFFARLWRVVSPSPTPVERTEAPKAQPQALPPVAPSGPDSIQDQARKLLFSIGCSTLAACVQVRWNPRMRSTAGMAFPGKSLVTLNPLLQQFGDEEVDRTLRHELAHLLAHHRCGRKRIAPHGAEWRKACADLGLPDESRCHQLPLPRRKVRKSYVYRCRGCATVIRRVRPFRRRTACMACCRAHAGGHYDERFRFERVPAANTDAAQAQSIK